MNERVAYDIKGACIASSIGRTSLYKAMGSGELVARKMGKKTVILHDDLHRFVNALPHLAPGAPANDNGVIRQRRAA
jgi:hypothetical protein